MAWILYFLVGMIAFEASAYRYPLSSQHLRLAPVAPDYDSIESVRGGPDCGSGNARSSAESRDIRVNERSIANSHLQKVQVAAKEQQFRASEPLQRRSENGSTKILNNFLKPVRRRGQIDSNPITFPGPVDRPARGGYEPQIPESCRNLTFCEDVPNYPQEEVDRLISRLGHSARFQLDRLDIPDTPDINQRLGPLEDTIELCKTDERVVYPKSAQGPDGRWYSLVNRNNDPVQGYRIEVCNFSHGHSCSELVVFQDSYEGNCVQKYVYRTVTAFERSGSDLRAFQQEVKVPSCCTCAAKMI